MKVYIDQSGKIEATEHDTVLVLTNGLICSVRIKAKTKRKLQEVFRLIGEPRTFVLTTFVACLYILIRNHYEYEINIDNEYPGHEGVIIKLLLKLFYLNGQDSPVNIQFTQVGKSSNAHRVAWETFRNKRKSTNIITFESLYEIMFITKNRRPVLKY